MTQTAEIIVCGAGITGISAAYHLSKNGIKDILIIDERPPLSFTSDRSTECYRNWWQDIEMVALMNRSIDIMESLAKESGNSFHMNRRGYLYVTADEVLAKKMESDARLTSEFGAGPIQIHSTDDSNYRQSNLEEPPPPTGADLLLGGDLIQKHYPYVTDKAVAALHVRRAGWLSAQQLGMHLLETARGFGVRYEAAKVIGVDIKADHVQGVQLSNGNRIECPIFVNAAGPYLKEVGKLLGIDIPVFNELHLKAVIKDTFGVVGRDAPLLIWNDPQTLTWEEAEYEFLHNDNETRWMTEALPAGAHTRPEGAGNDIIMLWEYKNKIAEVADPPLLDEQYPELTLRGLAAMLPRMQEYFAKMPRPQLDGGYYTKTRENRPIIGPTSVEGAYVAGAVSGYGIMAACGVGELLAAQVIGQDLPFYAKAFELSRYDDPDYQKKLENWSDSGQL